jgi:hypothetical protein
VKCLGDHATALCPRKEKSDDVRCVLCEGNLPANYKGCTIYKELLKKKYPPLRPKQYVNKANLQQQSTVRPNISNAQTLKNPQQEPLSESQPNNIVAPTPTASELSELKNMMKTLMEQTGTLLNLLTTVISKPTK